MFHKSQNTAVPNSLHLGGADFAGQPAILREVLIMPAKILAAVNVRTRGVDTTNRGSIGSLIAVEHILSHALANKLYQFPVKSSSHHILRVESHAAPAAHQAFGKSRRTIQFLCSWQIDCRQSMGIVGTVIDQIQHIRIANLTDQGIPFWIVIGPAHKVDGF